MQSKTHHKLSFRWFLYVFHLIHSSHDVAELFFDVLLGALFAAGEPTAQTFGNAAGEECRHDLWGCGHTAAAGLILLQLLADVRRHLLGQDIEQQHKAVRPDGERMSFWFAFANSNT